MAKKIKRTIGWILIGLASLAFLASLGYVAGVEIIKDYGWQPLFAYGIVPALFIVTGGLIALIMWLMGEFDRR